jgi:hypothetical protein
MMANKKLIRCIDKAIKDGFDKDKIKEKILEAGYDKELVEKTFYEMEMPKQNRFFKKVKFKLEMPKKVKEIPKPIKEVISKEELESLKEDVNPIIVDSTKDSKTGLKSTLEEVNQKLDILTSRDKKKEYKDFNLPSKFKRQLKKLALKNKILVILLTRNRGMIPMVTEIKDGFVNIEGTPHQCAVDQVFLWKGKYPAMVIPEWDIRPIGTADYYDAVKNHTIADPLAIAIRMLENKENIMKNKLSPKAWIFIGLAVIAGIYILFFGGGE